MKMLDSKLQKNTKSDKIVDVDDYVLMHEAGELQNGITRNQRRSDSAI